MSEKKIRRVAVDFDGTLVEEKWPEMGDWLPGAVEGLKRLANVYDEVVVFSCRVAPFDTDEETPRDNLDQIRAIDDMLWGADLPDNVTVWTRDFKPPAEVYIDDKAVRFTGDWNDVLMEMGLEPKKYWWMSSDPNRHPGSARFHELLAEAGRLHDQKQADYGRGGDPFANVRSSSEWGIPSWMGAMIRLNDKVKRLQTFARKGSLANEGVRDSFMDIAVYALIAHVLFDQDEVIP